MQRPALVCLDSSTWGLLSKDIVRDKAASHVLSLLNEGNIIPFFTAHHVLELTQHENDDEFKVRVAFLRTLKFVAFHKLKPEKANIGDLLNLRELEIEEVLKDSHITPEKVVERVRPRLVNGFTTGDELCDMNAEWWAFYRKNFAVEMRAHEAEIASISHMPQPNYRERIPEVGASRLRSREEVLRALNRASGRVADELRANGDPMLLRTGSHAQSPEELSRQFHIELWQENLALFDSTGDPFDLMLARDGVRRDRLPKKATIADVGYEAIFVKVMRKHESRLGLPSGAVDSIRQDRLPSWIVWKEMDRSMKRHLRKAEGSSLIDKCIGPFGLYTDALELDKRGLESIRQGGSRHSLLRQLGEHTFRRRSWGDLVKQLEKIASRQSEGTGLNHD
jgi:hypothetical protein